MHYVLGRWLTLAAPMILESYSLVAAVSKGKTETPG